MSTYNLMELAEVQTFNSQIEMRSNGEYAIASLQNEATISLTEKR